MKLWTQNTLLTVLLLLISSGCATTPKPKEESKVDVTLPKIKLTQNGIYADINAIAFEWKSIKDPRVKGVYVYKQIPTKESLKRELTYYKTVENRFATHFVDSEIVPNTQYVYAFKTFSQDAESSLSSSVVVESLPVLNSVSWVHSMTGMPQSAKIIWRPHSNQKVKSYLIERKKSDEVKYEEVAVVEGRLNAEYIDENLQNNALYQYRIRVVTYDKIVSLPSKSVKTVTKKLPKTVNEIVATKNLPKKIELRWEASIEKDFHLYYVYRSIRVNGDYKLVAKLHNNIFIDKIDEDAKKYFYKVSVVDRDGLESDYHRNLTTGMTLSKPQTPFSLKSQLLNNKIKLVWSSSDNRVKNYTVVRKEKQGWFNQIQERFEGVESEFYIDKNIKPESTYIYSVYAVDKNGIASELSREVEVKTLKSNTKMQIKENKTVLTVMPQEDIEVITQTATAVQDLELSEK